MSIILKTNINIPIIIEQLSAKGGLIDIAIKTGTQSIQGEILTRVNERGEAADNSDIGQYSTKPLYVNPNNSPRSFDTIGKNAQRGATGRLKKGQKKFANGKERKTRYFPDGYKGFKTLIGRNQINKVNLFLTGNMRDSFALIETERGWGLGWLNERTTVIANAMEVKYQKRIFSDISPEEKRLLVASIQDRLNKGL